MIIYPKEDVHLDRHVPEEIILSCELSRSNGVVSWYKDGQKLQESENIKLKIEGPYRRLKILSSGVEDSGEYVCDTADTSIFFHLSITGEITDTTYTVHMHRHLCIVTAQCKSTMSRLWHLGISLLQVSTLCHILNISPKSTVKCWAAPPVLCLI